jgi:hypothetical protein
MRSPKALRSANRLRSGLKLRPRTHHVIALVRESVGCALREVWIYLDMQKGGDVRWHQLQLQVLQHRLYASGIADYLDVDVAGH